MKTFFASVGMVVLMLWAGGIVGAWHFQLHIGKQVECAPVQRVK